MNYLKKNILKMVFIEKLKKKLIYEIIFARVKEISEIILFKNNNFSYYTKFAKQFFLN